MGNLQQHAGVTGSQFRRNRPPFILFLRNSVAKLRRSARAGAGRPHCDLSKDPGGITVQQSAIGRADSLASALLGADRPFASYTASTTPHP